MFDYSEYFYGVAIENGYVDCDVEMETDKENDITFMVLKGYKNGVCKELYIYDKPQKPIPLKNVIFTPTTRDYKDKEIPCYYFDMGDHLHNTLKIIKYVFHNIFMKNIFNNL